MLNVKERNKEIKEEQKNDKFFQFLIKESKKSEKKLEETKNKGANYSEGFCSGYIQAVEIIKANYVQFKQWIPRYPFGERKDVAEN